MFQRCTHGVRLMHECSICEKIQVHFNRVQAREEAKADKRRPTRVWEPRQEIVQEFSRPIFNDPAMGYA
jgi:hypothetical protein